MEEFGGGDRSHHHRSGPPSNRLLGVFSDQEATSAAAVELSEQDIFNTPWGSSSSSPTHSGSCPNPTRSHYSILAALNENLRTRSGSDSRPVFNHKASAAPVSLSPSSPRMMIPRKPPPPMERMLLRHQSAPVNVPAALRRRARHLEEVMSDEEEEEATAGNGVIFPPHEVVAARDSPLLANSVLEGAGRTLKGRDLRLVRNAIWRKTGFLD